MKQPAKITEAWVKDQIKKLLKEFGVYYFMPNMNGYGRAGVPDFVCCFKGLFIGIEAKAGSNGVSALQQLELSRIHNAQGIALVINETALDHLRAVLVKLNSLSKDSKISPVL